LPHKKHTPLVLLTNATESTMNKTALLIALTLIVACGPAPSNNGGGGGGGSDAGSSNTDAGGGNVAATTVCDLHASGVFNACVGCHGAQGGLTIDNSSAQALHDSLVGTSGASTNALVVGGDSTNSWLWVRMNEMQGESAMPPAGKLGGNQRNPVKAWIDANNLDDCL
jgi:hypothetical protein